jgi:hypothetical protein
MDRSDSTKNVALHIVEKQLPVDQLIMILYNSPVQATYNHFKSVNSHLKDGIARVGQVVLLSPKNPQECTFEEVEFLNVAEAVDQELLKLSNAEKEILAKRYEFLASVASYNGLLLGVSNTTWKAHTTQVENILKELERTYVASYKSTGNLNNTSFFAQRKILFTRLNTALSRFGQPVLVGNLFAGDIRSNLGLSKKSIIHQWNKNPGSVSTIPDFKKNYTTVAGMAKNLNRVGYVGIALTVMDAGANIQKACAVVDDAACSKSKYTQTGKAAGSIAGGAFSGTVAALATCSVVFGLPSGGSSLFWCAVVAGASGGYVGGKYGGELGEFIGEEVHVSTGAK